MSEDIKEIYLSNLEWTKIHDNMGGVIGNVVFKDNISYEEYEKLFDTVYYILTKKDEIETLIKRNKEIYEGFMATTQELCEATKEIERLNNIINELEKSKEKQINEYEILILKIERYLNCYQYFLETQEENNKKIANMIHEFSLKDSDE